MIEFLPCLRTTALTQATAIIHSKNLILSTQGLRTDNLRKTSNHLTTQTQTLSRSKRLISTILRNLLNTHLNDRLNYRQHKLTKTLRTSRANKTPKSRITLKINSQSSHIIRNTLSIDLASESILTINALSTPTDLNTLLDDDR